MNEVIDVLLVQTAALQPVSFTLTPSRILLV